MCTGSAEKVPTIPTLEEVAERMAEFDRVAGTEALGPPLSPAESRIARETRFQDEARQRKCAARAVLRQELDGGSISFAQLREDPTRGSAAAKLFDTWSATSRSEAIVETAYSVSGIYEDLRAAMHAQGLSTFNGRCAELGQRIVEAAIDYILDCHTCDAEAVEDDLRQERREYLRDEARARR